MNHLRPDIADALAKELADLDELSIDDIQRRMQWVWRQVIDATKDVEQLERAIGDVHDALDGPLEEAYVRSQNAEDRKRPDTYHQRVANGQHREQLDILRGLEMQKRIAERWLRSLDLIHHGLQTHSANVRALAAA